MSATSLNQELEKLNILLKNPSLSNKEKIALSEAQRKEALYLYDKADTELMFLKNEIQQLKSDRSFKNILLKLIS